MKDGELEIVVIVVLACIVAICIPLMTPTTRGPGITDGQDIIYIPVCEACVGNTRTFVGAPNKVQYDNGTAVWHQFYVCKGSTWNRIAVAKMYYHTGPE